MKKQYFGFIQMTEITEKNRRKVDAQKTKAEYLQAWKTKLEKERKSQESEKNNQKSGGTSWNLVVNNIAQTVGDSKGHKDTSRMRDVILNKSKDK